MKKTTVPVPGLWDSRVNGYTQCVTAGDLVFVAGQTGVHENGDIAREFEPQVRRMWQNLETALEAAGSDLKHLVATTTHLADLRHAQRFMEIRKEVLGDELATSAVLGGVQFVRPGVLVELQAIAIRKS